MKNPVAVLSGDVVNSSGLKAAERKELEQLIWKELERLTKKKTHFSVERGDSFQILLEKPEEALRKALEIRCVLKSRFYKDKRPLTDARISIGLGEVGLKGKTLSSSDGTAFRLSGRGLDSLKSGELHLAMATGHQPTDAALGVISQLMDAHLRAWNNLQAEAVLGRLQGLTYEQLSTKLGISASAAYNRIESAQWKLIAPVLDYFENLVKSLKETQK